MKSTLIDDALITMDQDAFEQEAHQRLERFRQAPDLEGAQRLYEQEVLPCEAARLQRAAEQRARDGEAGLELLFVTVGAQADTPALAVLASKAEFVVLLHTAEEATAAREVVERLALSGNQVALHEIGDGKNPIMLYKTCLEIWTQRKRPQHVGYDITGGFKTMSAAAAAAGFALPGARVFYIDTDKPRHHGKMFWVNERRVELDNPFEVFGEIRRATARELLRSGQYAAAAEAYGELAKLTSQAPDRFRALLAQGYGEAESMAFGTAATTLDALVVELEHRARDSMDLQDDLILVERERIRANAYGARKLESFVGYTSKDTHPEHEREALASDECRDFISMLLETARRQVHVKRLDVAALLAYRASEAVVQRRLVLRVGVDPCDMDWDAVASKAGMAREEILRSYYELVSTKNSSPPSEPPRRIGRAEAYAALTVAFPDDIAARGKQNKQYETFKNIGEARNRSLLAHGVKQLKVKSVQSMLDNASELFERMLEQERLDPQARQQIYARHQFLEVTGDHIAPAEVAP